MKARAFNLLSLRNVQIYLPIAYLSVFSELQTVLTLKGLLKEVTVMKKRILTFIIALAVVFTAVPSMSFAASTINKDDKAVVYTPSSDYKSGDCILTSTRNMIRRAAIIRGSKVWSKTTNATLRKDATILGLLWHNFSHTADGLSYNISMKKFTGKTEKDRIKEFETILKEHPEGIVVWGSKSSIWGQHGVLLTSVKNGVPYAADSAHNLGNSNRGIEAWSKTTMYSPVKCTQYWYIRSVTLGKGAKAPAAGKPLAPTSAGTVNAASTLKISDASRPSQVTLGNGFGVLGVVESNYRIKNVTVSVLNSSGKTVTSKSANPNTWNYNLLGVDPYVKFGILGTGTYRYKVTAQDEKKTATLVDATFKVVPKKVVVKPKSSLKIKSYNAPTKIKQGNGYVIKGKISSNKKIKKVTVQVVDASGKIRLSASKSNNKKSFNIKKLDPKVKFGRLPKGTYTYKIIAKDTKQTKTLVSKGFSVV